MTGDKALFSELLEAINSEHDSISQECRRLQRELARLVEKKAEDVRGTDDGLQHTLQRSTSSQVSNLNPSKPRAKLFAHIRVDDSVESSGSHIAQDGEPLSLIKIQRLGSHVSSINSLSEGIRSNQSAVTTSSGRYDLRKYHEKQMNMKRRRRASQQTNALAGFSTATAAQIRTVKQKLVKNKSEEQELERLGQVGLGAFVSNECFSLLSAILTLSNSVYVGVETNAQVQAELQWYFDRHLREEPDSGTWVIGNGVFVILFMLELLLRVAADGMLFCFGRDKWWNCFDVVVVISSIVELILAFADVKVSFGIGLLRSLKLVRIFRLMRLQKDDHNSIFSKFIRNLKTMLLSLGGSATSFLTAILLLVCIMYIFGLMFMQGLPGYLHGEEHNEHTAHKLQKYYGTLDKTLWSMIGSVTGGIDWSLVADPLREIGRAYVMFFLLYITFVLLGLLNILNGIFVQAAAQAAETNRELAIDKMIGQRLAMMQDMVNMFIEADADNSGTISWNEFELYLQDDRVKIYFETLGLDTSSIWDIFTVLDTKQCGELGLADFVEGCFRLRGAAKVIDLMHLQQSISDILRSQRSLSENLKRLDNRLRTDMDILKSCDRFLHSHSPPPGPMQGLI